MLDLHTRHDKIPHVLVYKQNVSIEQIYMIYSTFKVKKATLTDPINSY